MSVPLNTLADKFSALTRLRMTALEKLQSVTGTNGAQFDLSKQAPGAERPLSEIDARVSIILGMASVINGETDAQLIPQAFVNSLAKPMDSLTAQYQALSESLSNIDNNGGPGALDPESLTLQSANGQVSLQVGPIFQNIWNHSETVLAALYPLLNVIRAESQPDFAEALRTFSSALEQVHKQRATLADLAKQAQADRKRIGELLAQAGPPREEIERLKTESEKDRKTLAEYTAEGTQSVTAIRTTTEQAEKLKAAIDAYAPTFDKFQKQLDQREQAIQQGTDRQQALLKSIEEIETKITKLNEQAEAMLSGATVAGLAGSFGKLRDDLSKELGRARVAFYCAIGLLFASVVPLAGYIIPGLGEFLSLSTAEGHSQTATTSELIGQILARALLLLPAAWFAKFAAGRHAALFKLKEHYAYKYSVASSVEGFKRQAEPFKDAIAATTFFELTFNPADRMDAKGHEDRHPNPAMEWVMKKLGATYDGKN